MKELNPTKRFSNRADDYAKYRPTYPQTLIDAITANHDGPMVIADVGSGTGILSELLLDRDAKVYAVEPNKPMREKADIAFKNRLGFYSVDGTGEETTLDSDFADATCCAQSFHWFATANAAQELMRITRPGGSIWLIWNVRQTEATDFTRRYAALIDAYCPDYRRVRHENITVQTIQSLFDSAHVEIRTFRNDSELDWDTLWGRLRSSSYAPAPGDDAFAGLQHDLKDCFCEHERNGRIAVPMVCETFRISFLSGKVEDA